MTSSVVDAQSMWIDQRGSEVLPLPECVRLLALASKNCMIALLLLRVGEGQMARLAPGAFVAFEVDNVDQSTRRAWSVVVRGLASRIPRQEHRNRTTIEPAPLVPSPGDIDLTIRLYWITVRRFLLGSHPSRPESRTSRPEIRTPATTT